MDIKERIQKLRALMKEKNIDAYLVPTDDYHCSEYVGEFFKCRKYITGFTGSAGTAVIMQDMAGLWTDGRYFIQAAQQLEGSGVELFKMGEPGVPDLEVFLKEKLSEGQTLGFDGKTVAAAKAKELKELLEKKGVTLSWHEDLIGQIWDDRPEMSSEPVYELEERWSGKSRKAKCEEIRELMKKKGADIFLLTTLDDIAWLLNIRGGDIHCCPVVLSYLMMTEEEITLFVNEKTISDEIKANLAADGVKIQPYDAAFEAVKEICDGKKIIMDLEKVNYLLAGNVPENVEIIDETNLTLLPKAIKNETEVNNEKIAHIKDGVALTKFIYWLKQNVGKIRITEISAAEKLLEFRKEQENFLDNSFDPIVAYRDHAALAHYSATPESDAVLEAKGMLLADTGGHYLEGTTDTTRTIVLGETTDEEKKFFTAVLRGTLNLAAAKFRYGCMGINLDYLARQPLWELGEDYNHGTGHGVGYLLNVHEMPNSFRWKLRKIRNEGTVFEEGMITSDEPGYYVEGKFGIRHENLIVCKKAEKTAVDQFMCFETITMVPFDLDAIVPEQMSERERGLLNVYHKDVYDKISPYLNEEEKIWLKEATREI